MAHIPIEGVTTLPRLEHERKERTLRRYRFLEDTVLPIYRPSQYSSLWDQPEVTCSGPSDDPPRAVLPHVQHVQPFSIQILDAPFANMADVCCLSSETATFGVGSGTALAPYIVTSLDGITARATKNNDRDDYALVEGLNEM